MHSSNFSSSNGSTEDLFRDSIDSCDNDITEKVGLGGRRGRDVGPRGWGEGLLTAAWGLGRPCPCPGVGDRWPRSHGHIHARPHPARLFTHSHAGLLAVSPTKFSVLWT